MRYIVPLLAMWLSATAVEGVSIGVFGENGCSFCDLVIPNGETRTAYVMIAHAPSGVTNAYLRIIGVPVGWTATATPVSGITTFGDPLGPLGGGVAFPSIRFGGCLPIYTLAITATTAEENVVLHVVAPEPPVLPPGTDCPSIRECSVEPCPFTQPTCVIGSPLFINNTGFCEVATRPTQWTAMKELFR